MGLHQDHIPHLEAYVCTMTAARAWALWEIQGIQKWALKSRTACTIETGCTSGSHSSQSIRIGTQPLLVRLP